MTGGCMWLRKPVGRGYRGHHCLVSPPGRFSAVLTLLVVLLSTGTLAQPAAPPSDLAAIVEMVEAGRSSQAEQALRTILEDQDGSVARDLLGVVLGQQGRLEEAELEFRRAIDLGPELLAPRQHLGRLYLQRQRPEKALAELRAATALGPLERDLAFRLAAAETASGDLEAAERQLRSLADRFDSAKALLGLARLQARRGDREEAIASLLQGMKLAPNSEEFLSAYARVSLAALTPVPAIRALEALNRMHPAVADHAYLLGVAWLQFRENDGAVEALERALRLEPDRARTLTALGMAFNSRKEFDRAKTALVRSLELAPQNVEALAAIAEAEEGLGELEEAERHAQAVLAMAANHFGARLVIGKVRMNEQRYAEARDALLQAVAADPSSSKAHYQLSLAYARLGDSDNSRRHVELYRKTLREFAVHLVELRTRAGLGSPGMGR